MIRKAHDDDQESFRLSGRFLFVRRDSDYEEIFKWLSGKLFVIEQGTLKISRNFTWLWPVTVTCNSVTPWFDVKLAQVNLSTSSFLPLCFTFFFFLAEENYPQRIVQQKGKKSHLNTVCCTLHTSKYLSFDRINNAQIVSSFPQHLIKF